MAERVRYGSQPPKHLFTPNNEKMAAQKLFCWTVCVYHKPGMSEEDYHKYMSEVHAQPVRDLMVKYGIVSWEMVHPLPFHLPSAPLLPF
jgi:hypothetical protein